MLFTEGVAICWDMYDNSFFLTLYLARLLHEWVSRPLCDLVTLQSRQEALSELLHSESAVVHQLWELLDGIPDIDRGLTTCIHQRVYLNIM
jgi:DNA mismatch repair ATPase MutS